MLQPLGIGRAHIDHQLRLVVGTLREEAGSSPGRTPPRADGNRLTAFATNTPPGGPGGQLADLELRHHRRARAEDRIRTAKDTGLTTLPLHGMDQNKIWCAVVALAAELTAWAQLLALTEHPARRWEPKRLRLRLFSVAGRLTRSGRRTVLHMPAHAPWADLLRAITTMRALPAPG